jgi:hypothetical protein
MIGERGTGSLPPIEDRANGDIITGNLTAKSSGGNRLGRLTAGRSR